MAKAAKSATDSKLGDVTAPAVSGYSFLAWVIATTAGWVGAFYFETPLSATTGVWCAADASTTSGATLCYALYARNA